MNDNIKNIELVKKSYEELQDEVIKLTTNKFILQSNWNSLREDLKRYDLTYLHETGEHQLADVIEDILDKMNELEGKDNN